MVEVKARLKNFDEVRENFAKLGVWLKDKGMEKQNNILDLKETYGYKEFKIFLHDVQNIGKFIEISMQAKEENQEYARKKCLDLLNFLALDKKIID